MPVRAPSLETAQGRNAPLPSLDIEGRLDPALARVRRPQTFRDAERRNVEAVHPFALPAEGVPLDSARPCCRS